MRSEADVRRALELAEKDHTNPQFEEFKDVIWGSILTLRWMLEESATDAADEEAEE